MASSITSRAGGGEARSAGGAKILLVNTDLRDLAYYGAILRKAGCRVRASSSFAEGVQCLDREPYDLILLDQGKSGFEGREVLERATQLDQEVQVLILARAYNRGCYCDAMQSGALDYLEGLLSPEEIVALLETYTPCGTGSRGNSASQGVGDAPSNHVASGKCSPRDHTEQWQWWSRRKPPRQQIAAGGPGA